MVFPNIEQNEIFWFDSIMFMPDIDINAFVFIPF